MPALRFPERLARLQGALARKKLHALLVTQPANRRYLSDYTATDHGIQESAGVLLVPRRGQPYLLTIPALSCRRKKKPPVLASGCIRRGCWPVCSGCCRSLPCAALVLKAITCFIPPRPAGPAGGKDGLSLVPVTDMVEPLRTVKTDGEIDKNPGGGSSE